jgi:aspartate/methionine/tyrosine aminotransferase
MNPATGNAAHPATGNAANSATDPVANSGRGGRFPPNDIISLLDVNRRYNLAESTAKDLSAGELFDLVGAERLRAIPLGYGSSRGLAELRAIIGERGGVPVDSVLTTTGVALGLAMLALELCRSGDEAVLVGPCFPPSRDGLLAGGGRVRHAALRFEDSYRLDVELIASHLGPATRLVSLASPQNPGGVTATPGEIDLLLAAMARAAPEAYLFIDETYREATYGDHPQIPSFAPRHPRIITGASVSKAHGAPGLRVGWLTSHDHALLERLATAKMNLVISGSPLNEALAAGLLRNQEAVLAPRRAMLARAMEIMDAWMAANAGLVEWVRPHAGALCCVRLRPERFGDDAVGAFWNVLPAADLQLAEGTWFGEPRRTMRLGFGYLPLDTLPAALEALGTVLRERCGA